MALPNLPKKLTYSSFFSPINYINYIKSKGLLPSFEIPSGIVFCYQPSLLKHILKTHKTKRVNFFAGEFYLIEDCKKSIGVCAGFGIGAPLVVTILEETIALGTKQFLNIGTCGSIQKDISIGDVVVCDRAIRDEGVSYHYLPTSKYSNASISLTKKLTEKLNSAGINFQVGTSWTIDAPFRETFMEINKYRDEGVLTVEMEAAALFAVAQYRKVELASTFVVSDTFGDVWEPHFRSPSLANKLNDLFDISLSIFDN